MPEQGCEVHFRVRYAETDQMGIVHHANYLVWMELARTELCRRRGVRYRDFELETGLSMAVVEINVRYRRPAKYDDEIEALAWIEKAHPRQVVFGYEIKQRESGELLTTGETKHILLTREGKPSRIPARFYPLFGIPE